MARLDVVGVFGYSDEDGTEAESLPDQARRPRSLPSASRRVTDLVEQLTAQRAEERIGSEVTVLIEAFDDDEGMPVGRAEFQGPEVDGVTSCRVRTCGSVTSCRPSSRPRRASTSWRPRDDRPHA
jgi:ribosomal protein S12 methylthiotransferase